MDEIDCANDRGQFYVDAAVALYVGTIRQNNFPSTGVCRTCGELIESDRLRANANALDCYDCAAEKEAERVRARRRGAR